MAVTNTAQAFTRVPSWRTGGRSLQLLVKPVVKGVQDSECNFRRLKQLTIAGPAAELEPLLAKLKAEEVFVRELDTLGIAYHSPGLRAYADELAAGVPLTLTLLPNFATCGMIASASHLCCQLWVAMCTRIRAGKKFRPLQGMKARLKESWTSTVAPLPGFVF